MKELKFSLKWFLSGKAFLELIEFMKLWAGVVKGWIEYILINDDPQTCSIEILNEMAWERRVVRLNNEPLWLYRNRVDFAFINERDAGSTAGLKRIFERLGVGFIVVTERAENKDWDVVVLQLSSGDLVENQELLSEIIRLYGRTCRRYELTVSTITNAYISSTEFSSSNQTFISKILM